MKDTRASKSSSQSKLIENPSQKSQTKTSVSTLTISKTTFSATQSNTSTSLTKDQNTNTNIDQTIKLSLGKYHTFMTIKNNTTQQSSIKAWGLNYIGQLGLRDTVDTNTPELLTPSNFIEISSKAYHSCAIADDNSVYCWGSNNFGQSGQENINLDLSSPTKITNLTAKQISVGAEHSCIISKSTNDVFCWGLNSNGQLGSEQNDTDSFTPLKVPGLNTQTLSSGYFHNCVIEVDQSIKCWGANSNGQLGRGNFSYFSGTPNAVSGSLKFKSLSSGFAHTCAISVDDDLYCWGYNKYGQLGLGSYTNFNSPQKVPNLSKVLSVSSGFGHTCAILSDKSVSCWGHNQFGQLGLGLNGPDLKSPTLVNSLKATSIYTGEFHTCAVLLDNKVFCWGANKFGQLGLGNNFSRTNPTELTGSPTVANDTFSFQENYAWSINDTEIEKRFFDKKLVVNGVIIVGSKTIENETMSTLTQLLEIMTRNMPQQYRAQLAGGKIGVISEYDLPSKFGYLGNPMDPSFKAWLKSTVDHGWRGFGGAGFALVGEELTCHYGIPSRTTNNDTGYRRLDHLAHEYGHQIAQRLNMPPLNFDIIREKGRLINDTSNNGEWPAWDSQYFFSQQSWSDTATGNARDLDPRVLDLFVSIFGPVPSATELDLCPKRNP